MILAKTERDNANYNGGVNMWIFNKDGFFSAVEYTPIKTCVLVRGRFEGDLENMLTHLGKSDYSDVGVVHTPEHDYSYRVVVKKRAWAKYVWEAAKDIDYPNFKDAVVPYYGEERERSEKYHEVWAVLRSNHAFAYDDDDFDDSFYLSAQSMDGE